MSKAEITNRGMKWSLPVERLKPSKESRMSECWQNLDMEGTNPSESHLSSHYSFLALHKHSKLGLRDFSASLEVLSSNR